MKGVGLCLPSTQSPLMHSILAVKGTKLNTHMFIFSLIEHVLLVTLDLGIQWNSA